jgi:catechol 2,3-dioxygenase-like lactoylglutathione lyase family enzyme
MYYKPNHTAIKVIDLKKSIEFYEKAFNFKVYLSRRYEESGIETVFMKAKNHDFLLQLIWFPFDIVVQTDYGHFSVSVDDAAKSYSEHKKSNYDLGPLSNLEYQISYFIKDPDGYETEVIQLIE